MSGIAVQCNVRFGKGLKRSQGAEDSMRVPRVTRMLALAYHIDRLIDSGRVKDYAEAARIFGVTRGRMTQVMNLLNLSARIQELLLSGELHVSEGLLREIVRDPIWGHQLHELENSASNAKLDQAPETRGATDN